MRKHKLTYHPNDQGQPDRKALIFGLASVLLYGLGFGLTAPVVPFLVQPYVHSPQEGATAVGLLTFIYAVCVFLAAPGLGALSDRYGRRPVLMLCLLGSAAGYLIFGIGGALGVLFLGRIIDGVTGGNISIILAYFADITPKDQRIKYFGWAGAASGIGFIIGPALGGLLAKLGYATPMYFGVLVTLVNMLYGVLYMPETLSPDSRLDKIEIGRLNPFTQLSNLLKIQNLKWIFAALFLLGVPSGSLQAFYSQFAKDLFNWAPVMIGAVFSIFGAMDILTQSLIMPKLLRTFKEGHMALLGMGSELAAYGLILASGVFKSPLLFIAGTAVFGFGDAIWGPTVSGMASSVVSAEDQGWIQGGMQSLQALTRIIGPVLGGTLYVAVGPVAPAIMGVILAGLGMTILYRSLSSPLEIESSMKSV